MAKSKTETTKPTRRTQVKELPKDEQELSRTEQQKVKGGKANFSGTWILAKDDGSPAT